MASRLYSPSYLRKFWENIFVICRLEDEETSFTYKDVLHEVSLQQQHFNHLKLPPFSGVGLLVQDDSPALIALLLSLLNNDCFFCPFDPRTSEADISLALLSHRANYLVSDCDIVLRENWKLLGFLKIFQKRFSILAIADDSEQNSRHLRSREICYSIATTGSTGTPKVVHVPYKCIYPNISQLSCLLDISASDVIFLGTPYTFDPFIVELFLAMQNGAALLITSQKIRLAPQKSIQCLFPSIVQQSHMGQRATHSAVGVTILQMTPSIFRQFGETGIHNILLSENTPLRALILGGEEFPTIKEWRTWLPSVPKKTTIYNVYGITELSCWSMVHKLEFEEKCNLIPLGEPLDDIQLRIINSDNVVMNGVTEGKLQIGSAKRRCYIPSIDSEACHYDKFLFRNTGDWVRRDVDGNIFYLGRTDNTIKRLGKRLCLETLQRKILSILAYRCEQAICVWDQTKQKLCCFLTENYCNGRTFDLNHCQKLLMSNLRNEEKPDVIIPIEGLYLNAHGKVDRCKLLEHLTRINRIRCKRPVDILHNFLDETLGFNTTEATNIGHKLLPPFLSIGGTSFQAISLATEISALVVNTSSVQSKLLEILLDSQQSLSNVILFLTTCKIGNCRSRETTKPVFKSKEKSFEFCLQWRANFGKCVDSTPVIINDCCICVGAHSRKLLTLDIEYGNMIAQMELPDRIECKVEWGTHKQTQIAFVGCYNGHLYVFDAMSGKINWSVDVGGMIKAKALLCVTGVIVASYAESYNLVNICIQSHKILWRRKIGTKGIYASPITFDTSSILICTLDGTYSRIDINSGQTIWECKTTSPIFSTPAIITNGLYFIVAEVAGKLHFCNASYGNILQTFVTGGNIFSSVTVTPHAELGVLILFGCYDNQLYCVRYTNLDESNGHSLKLLWTVSMGASIFATPTLLTFANKRYVLGCSTKGLLMILVLDDGEVKTMHEVNIEVFSTPCILDNRIYFGGRDNYVYAFKIQ